VNDTTTNSTFYPVFVGSTGTNQTATVSSSKLYFNPSSGTFNAVTLNSLSDVAFKQNLCAQVDSLAIINKISTYSFDWKHNGQKSYGVIAQELEQILPELVQTNDDGVKSVSYLPLIAILIDAIKKLQNNQH
jgi:hypothetical protein